MRYRSLDVLRGFALLGIFPVNLPYFALPVAEVEAALATGVLDRWAGELTRSFFMLRFVTIFSFLFGVGLVLLARKCERASLPRTRVLVVRLLALLGFGGAHVVFLWFGDILVFYAGTGLLALLFLRVSPRVLTVLGLLGVLVPPLALVTVGAAFPETAEWLMEFSEGEVSEDVSDAEWAARAAGDWEGFFRAMKDLPPAFESAVYREGSYGRQVVLRIITWLFYLIFASLFFLPRVAGMMLLGVASARSGWILDPAAHPRAFRRCRTIGLGLGLSLQVASFIVQRGDPSASRILIGQGIHAIAGFAMAAGYVGVVGWLCTRPGGYDRLVPLERLGRMAFTAYILQSVIAASLFYGWGAGLYGSFGLADLWLVVIVVWVAELCLATAWLGRFRHGPLEWLWRRITYAGLRRAA